MDNKFKLRHYPIAQLDNWLDETDMEGFRLGDRIAIAINDHARLVAEIERYRQI